MIIASLPGRKIGISFRHYSTPMEPAEAEKILANRKKHSKKKQSNVSPAHQFTSCVLYLVTGTDATILSSGISRCVDGDQFNKEIGRKLSLDRALQVSTVGHPDVKIFDRQDRALLWEAYFDRGSLPTVMDPDIPINVVTGEVVSDVIAGA